MKNDRIDCVQSCSRPSQDQKIAMAVDIRARLNFRPGAVNRHHGHGRRRLNPWQTWLSLAPTSEILHAEIFLDLQGGTKISEVGTRDFNMQTYKKLLPGTPECSWPSHRLQSIAIAPIFVTARVLGAPAPTPKPSPLKHPLHLLPCAWRSSRNLQAPYNGVSSSSRPGTPNGTGAPLHRDWRERGVQGDKLHAHGHARKRLLHDKDGGDLRSSSSTGQDPAVSTRCEPAHAQRNLCRSPRAHGPWIPAGKHPGQRQEERAQCLANSVVSSSS